MDLLAAAFDVGEQAKQPVGHLGVLREEAGPLADRTHIAQDVRQCEAQPILLVFSTGRVATARYSRRICPLVHGAVPPAAQSLTTVSASRCCALPSSVAARNTNASSIARSGWITRSAALVGIDFLPDHVEFAVVRTVVSRIGGGVADRVPSSAVSRIARTSCLSESPCLLARSRNAITNPSVSSRITSVPGWPQTTSGLTTTAIGRPYLVIVISSPWATRVSTSGRAARAALTVITAASKSYVNVQHCVQDQVTRTITS